MVTHFCWISYWNESNPYDEYTESICWLQEFKEWTNNEHFVTCKKCIKKIKLLNNKLT